jgi:hypothetical protein
MKRSATLLALALATHLLPAALPAALAQAPVSGASDEQRDLQADFRTLNLEYRSALNRVTLFSRSEAYTADETVERRHTLPSGGKYESTRKRTYVQKSDGRVRIDLKDHGSKGRYLILDVQKGEGYMVRPHRGDVLRVTTQTSAPIPLRPAGVEPPVEPNPYSRQVQTPLGIKEMEGVPAYGTLVETHIAAGLQGNDTDIVETRETWRSFKLGLTLLSRSSSPRSDEHVTRVENLKLGEAPEDLFQLPLRHTVRDMPPALASH